MSSAATKEGLLGTYLKDRRAKLDPAAFGLPLQRRRTPGLRREEVAQRANVSATWYTWLEQGRGGAPSADVLDRIARALMLTDAEREHLFLIALGRPPEVRYHASEGVSPRLQRVLDAFELCPAIVKTVTWDVIAWNRSAQAVLADYAELETHQRNVLRLMFCDPRARAAQRDWESVARSIVATFRADVARAGASLAVQAFVDEMKRLSPEFEMFWRDNDVRHYREGIKHIVRPPVGPLALEYSSFAVEGRADLAMIVFNPATPEDAAKVRALLESGGIGR